jgi:hypothetical protein
MVNMTTTIEGPVFKGKCQKCGVEISPADSIGQFNRNLGMHMRFKHGVASPFKSNAEKYLGSKRRLGSSKVVTVPTVKRMQQTNVVATSVARPRRSSPAAAPQLSRVSPATVPPESLTIAATNSLFRLSSKTLRQMGHLYLRAAGLKQKLERALTPSRQS